MGCGGSKEIDPEPAPKHQQQQQPPPPQSEPPPQQKQQPPPKQPTPPLSAAEQPDDDEDDVDFDEAQDHIGELIKLHSGHEDAKRLHARVATHELNQEELDRLRAISKEVHVEVANVGRLYHLFEEFADDGEHHTMRQRGLTKAFNAMGVEIPDKRFQKLLFDTFDNEHHGELHFDDFVSHLAGLVQCKDLDSMFTLFQIYDVDNSGYLEGDEIRQLVRVQKRIAQFVMGQEPEDMSDELIDDIVHKLMAKFDDNGDEKISFEEFVDVMKHLTDQGTFSLSV